MLSTKIKTAKECRDQDPDFGGGKDLSFLIKVAVKHDI